MPITSKLRAVAPPDSTRAERVDGSLSTHFTLLNALPFGFILMDKCGVIQACNTVGRSMFQFRNMDIVAMHGDKLLAQCDRILFNESLQDCLKRVTSPVNYVKTELQGLKKDGTRFPIEIQLKTKNLDGRDYIACTVRDITKRRHNEVAISKKEEKLQLALQGAELWIWEFDYRTNLITHELQKSTGTNVSNRAVKLEFESWIELIHPNNREMVLESLARLESGNSRRFNFEYKIKRKDGHWDWIYSSGKISKYDEDGLPITADGTNLNISDRKYSEQRLREKNASLIETERRLRLAQEAGGVASWERDLNLSRLTYCSDNLASLYGLDNVEKISTVEGWLSTIHPEDRAHVVSQVEAAKMNVEAQLSLEYRVIWPDSSIHWLTFRALIICDEQNKPIKLTGTSYDVTDRISTQQNLQESEERFKSAFNQSAIPMLLISRDDGIFRVNEAMSELTNYSEDELLEMNLLKLVHPGDRTDALKHMSKAIKGEIEKFSTEARYRTKLNETKWMSANIVSIKDKQDSFRYAVVQLKDITEEHNLSTKLVHETTHDSLTGLVNRREFENRLINSLQQIELNKTESALAYLDLDQFKVINDTCGHAAGDELLRQLSVLFSSSLRKDDVIARLGGDEFGVFMEGCNLNEAELVIREIHKVLNEFRFVWEDKTFNVTISSGLVSITDEAIDIIEILKRADAACYAAKDAGRNRLHIFHPQDEELSRRSGEMQWVARITSALEEDRFQLYCQPIASVETVDNNRLYYEVLVRLEEENGDLVSPGAFLPAAERYGLSLRLDKWVIGHTLAWLSAHPEHVERLDLCCINFSGLSLGDAEMLAFIEEKFTETKIPPNKICFEITETAAIENLRNATKFIKDLKQLGCLFALDDFGSGLSSFAYLKTLEVDILKIDGGFVREIVTDPVDLAMVRSINEIGKVLGKRTTAEFVENDEILAILKEIGVDRAQGYGISRPLPLKDLISSEA